MLFLFCCHFRTSPKFCLCIFYETFGERSDAIVNIFEGEYITWPTGQSLNLCASIFQSCYKSLNLRTLVYHIQMTLSINLVVLCHCKLLEWMNKGIYLFRLVFETTGKSRTFWVQCLHCRNNQVSFDIILINCDFSPRL